MKEKRVKVAYIADAHGIKGEVKVKPLLTDPETLALYSPLSCAEGIKFYAFVISGKLKDHVICRIKGIENRNDAEALKGTSLYAPGGSFPPLADDKEFYWHELEGMTVLNLDKQPIGKVCHMYNFGAGDILEIEFNDGEKTLQPFIGKVFTEIDREARTLLYQPLEEI